MLRNSCRPVYEYKYNHTWVFLHVIILQPPVFYTLDMHNYMLGYIRNDTRRFSIAHYRYVQHSELSLCHVTAAYDFTNF